MITATDRYIDCHHCGRPADRGAWYCPYCGADVGWMLEEQRLAKEYLRYFSVSLLGGVLLAVAILVSLGALVRHATPLVPILVGFTALSVALWLWSGNFDASSSHTRRTNRRS